MALIKKGDTYFVRYTIPTARRKALGRAQVWRTTKTTDKAEAKRRSHRIVGEIIESLDAELEGREAVSPTVSAKDLLAQVASGELDTDSAREILEGILEANSAPERQRRSAASMVASGGTFMPLADAIEDYRKTREGNMNASTLRRVENVLKAFMEWQGEGDVGRVTRRVAGQYVADVIVPAETTFKTKTWHVSALRQAWRYFVSREWAADDRNPWDGHLDNYRASKRGTSETTARRNWTTEELAKLNEIDRDDDLYAIAVLCLHHGTRVEEIAGLTVADVDLTEKSFTIREGKNQSSVRTMPIHKACVSLFTSLTDGKAKGEPLFGLKASGADSKFSHLLSKRAGRWLRKNVTEDKSLVFFHSMRHTFTTALETAGTDPHIIKRLTGHSFQDETFGRYSKGPGLDRLREALDAVEFGF